MGKKRGRPSRRETYLGATQETASKLRPDPLFLILQSYGNGDVALERAADEIKAIYLAVCGQLMAGIGGLGGGSPMPDFIAWAHATTYLPWARATKRQSLEAVIDTVVDRNVVSPLIAPQVAVALHDYARRILSRPAYEREVA